MFADIRTNFSGTPDVRIVFSDPQKMVVYTDEYFLKSVMRNLSSNAVKSLAGNPESAIHWRAYTENDARLFSVTGNGPGITAEALKPLYDDSLPFILKSGQGPIGQFLVNCRNA